MQNKNNPLPPKKSPRERCIKKVININFHKQTSLQAHDKGPDSPTNTINKCHSDTNFQWCRHEKKRNSTMFQLQICTPWKPYTSMLPQHQV